jgi:hypothetical protein
MLTILHQLMGGLRSSMGYTGCASIEEMRNKPEFIRVTNAGMRESHVHDVTITKEGQLPRGLNRGQGDGDAARCNHDPDSHRKDAKDAEKEFRKL